MLGLHIVVWILAVIGAGVVAYVAGLAALIAAKRLKYQRRSKGERKEQ